MPVAQLASRWPEIVGERLAAETAPAAFEDGVLTVEASNGPWGAQATFLHEEIRRRPTRRSAASSGRAGCASSVRNPQVESRFSPAAPVERRPSAVR